MVSSAAFYGAVFGGFLSLKRCEGWISLPYALPLAWMFGRLGCALAHDHRGLPSTSWIAVQFPEGPRYDLGIVEFLFLIGLAVTFRLLDRRPRPTGFFFGLFGVVYGSFRIWLDTLHIQPMRFYGGAAAVVIGLLGWIAMSAFERSRTARVQPPRVVAGQTANPSSPTC